MAQLAQPEKLRGESIEELCSGLEPELRRILLRYHIPQMDAELLLREATLEVLYKSRSRGEFAVRLPQTLASRCRIYWETRRWRYYRPLDGRLLVTGRHPYEPPASKRRIPATPPPQPAQGGGALYRAATALGRFLDRFGRRKES